LGEKRKAILGALHKEDTMKIGIDISVLQTAHRMRGIGYVAINLINNLPESAKEKHSFVLYHYPIRDESPLDLLGLEGINYTLQEIKPYKPTNLGLPGRLNLLSSLVNKVRMYTQLKFGSNRIKDSHSLDHLIQFDQSQPIPARRKVPTTVVLYDIIPYVMENDYLWGYKTARGNGKTRRGAFRANWKRRRYKTKLKLISRRAKNLVAISEYTKRDFVKHLKIPAKKISVALLGVNEMPAVNINDEDPKLLRYIETSWGPMPRKASLKDTRFILFVGGADPRRKLSELVASFNNLRAQGVNVKLVLAGDTMRGPLHIPNNELQEYFSNSSYLDDIYFMGFVTDEQRDWLYKNAIAFVYPSVYEGFGLPVLEAMQYGAPVITYDNTSIKEVAHDSAIYTTDFRSIQSEIQKLINDEEYRAKYSQKGIEQSGKFSWASTAERYLQIIES
jgi:glycosyltransferase involved in cell wall biosynthesis